MRESFTDAAASEAGRRRAARRRNLAIRLASVLALLLLWEICGLFTPRIFLSPFHDTLMAFWRMCRDGTLLAPTLSSLSVLIAGLAVSLAAGAPLGLLMGRYARLDWALSPYVNGLYATPTVALLPVLSLWLGLYVAPKIAIVVLLAIFPIIKNTFAGVATVGQELVEPASSMQASEFQIARHVIAPAIIPFVMAGIRLSVGRGIVGLVVGEFFTAQTGLGGLLIRYASNFRTAEMFVPIFVLVAIGYGLTALVVVLQERIAPWKETERDLGR
ncbi:MAG TPA: ABC transporter permease [Xanthobacteraceae bacterium]|jgi:NitT/TauT family transport system permease protein